MTTLLAEFEKLTPAQLYDILKLRQDIFMIEQNCLYKDMDNSDSKAYHLLMYEGDVLAAYLRIFAPGIKYKEASIGRIVVSPDFRGGQLGKELIKSGISRTFELFEDTDIRIEAQAALKNYYKQFGFAEEGKVYVVDDIDHLQMVLKKIS
ncbi:MAG: GNAT family N-acetyltransferase [Balneola sp.]